MLQSECVAQCMCCKVYVLQSTHIVKCTCCKVHVLQNVHVSKCKISLEICSKPYLRNLWNLDLENFKLKNFNKFLVQNNCGSKIILGPKWFLVKNNFGSKKILDPKNIFCPKKFQVQKNVSFKKLLAKFKTWLRSKV